MIRLILLSIFFLSSLLVLFRAPTNLLWYVSILITEFCWVAIGLVILLLLWRNGTTTYHLVGTILGTVSIVLLLLPLIQAYQLDRKLQAEFAQRFPSALIKDAPSPFQPLQIMSGIGDSKVPYETFTYDGAHGLKLDFYKGAGEGRKPCVVVIHGGSWAAGDSRQLPELNSVLAKDGYHVASINYRLAPGHHYPAPIEDVQKAINYLQRNAQQLSIDSTRFVLLGRSAGGQIALTAAYTLPEPAIRSVICFYGPTDMVWGYENPTSPLVLDSRKIMEDYLGGTLDQKRDAYRQSSATETVTSKTPPTLLIYGEHDPLVSPRHGTRLSIPLKAANIPHFELYLPWGTHGFDYTLNGPGGQLSTWLVRRWLEVVVLPLSSA